MCWHCELPSFPVCEPVWREVWVISGSCPGLRHDHPTRGDRYPRHRPSLGEKLRAGFRAPGSARPGSSGQSLQSGVVCGRVIRPE
ncbi:hypothetical protein FRUB_07144 [Fimbriiglobus ruber]|uniref:Uncharacterized protein n=1 Tax=Fimbriiglobus ruber TaxID=1908690 RepID=A0A225DEF5_9BACT|nr:hypothetical protein FRUB_07144 [Fimbriiglobus ruber]